MKSKLFAIFAPLAFFALFVTTTGCKSDERALAQRLDKILHRLDDTGAIYSARVIDLETGKEIYKHRADEPMIPASNGKLAPGMATLDRLGPDYVFKTTLAVDGNDLWLIGRGDPATGDPAIATTNKELPTTMLDQWSEQLLARGINRIKGDLVYFDGTFDNQWINDQWAKDDLTYWYAAPVSGLTFNDNCMDVLVTPQTDGQPARVEPMPPNDWVTVVNRTVSGGKSSAKFDRDKSENVFTASGNVAKSDKLDSKPVTDPGRFFAEALRYNFKLHGILIDGKIRRADKALALTPQNTIAVHETTLREVLHRVNKNSQNLFAEAVSKTLGRQYDLDRGLDRPGSWTSGSEAVHAFLTRNKINDSRYVMIDGSGLARGNRVTTRMLSDLFVLMHHHKYGQDFLATLPIGGVDGTIGKRMKDIAGQVHAKTGYIGGVRSLSGYVETNSGKWLVFSIIFNEIPGSVAPFEALQDDACRAMVYYPQAPPATQPSTRASTKPVPRT